MTILRTDLSLHALAPVAATAIDRSERRHADAGPQPFADFSAFEGQDVRAVLGRAETAIDPVMAARGIVAHLVQG